LQYGRKKLAEMLGREKTWWVIGHLLAEESAGSSCLEDVEMTTGVQIKRKFINYQLDKP